MKHRIIQMALLVATAAAGTLANAQSIPDMRVNIPFEFHAAGQTLPAGVYFVTVGSAYRRIDLRSLDGHQIFLTANPGNRISPDRSSLAFNRYGETYFLREIRSARQQFGGQLPPSREEKALTNVAGLQPVVETIAAGAR